MARTKKKTASVEAEQVYFAPEFLRKACQKAHIDTPIQKCSLKKRKLCLTLLGGRVVTIPLADLEG